MVMADDQVWPPLRAITTAILPACRTARHRMARSPCARTLREGNALTTSGGRHPRDIRSFMGYCSSLPIDEFRSIEVVLDDLCAWSCRARQIAWRRHGEVECGWRARRLVRPSKASPGHLLYLHGRVHCTSPRMYAFFVATLDAALTVKSLWLTTGWRPSSLPAASRMRRSSWKRSSTATQTGRFSSRDSGVEVWSPR